MSIITYMLYCLFIYVNTAKKRSEDDKKCISQNYWNSISSSEKVISDTSTCTKVYSQCCHIEITYKYVNYEITSSYCASLYRNIDEVTKELTNLYRDNLIFYSNYTLNHKDQYKEIGLNYEDPEYYKDYNCVKPINAREYSTYLYNACGKFSEDKKTCYFEKNSDYFEQFYQDFHDYYSNGYCSKKYKDKKCIEYYGVMGNPQMIRPLFVDLKKYLIEGQNSDESEDQVSEADDDVEVTDYWIKQCIDLPDVTVTITAPTGYQYSIYFKYSFLYIILIFIIIY